MMYKFIILYIFVLSFIYSCIPEPDDLPPTLKPYDPQKAGAKIIESYDLSDIYMFYQADNHLHISEYNNKFYIIHDEKIHIYNKDTMAKENYLNFDIKYFYPKLDRKAGDTCYNENIAVLKGNILFSYYISIISTKMDKKIFFNMDLSGDNIKELDVSTDFGLNSSYFKIGNNSNDNKFVILMNNQLKYYEYDNTNDKYFETSSINMPLFYYDEYSIKSDIIWYMYVSNWMTLETFIEKRDLTNPNVILKKINADYLGTQIPESILYDGEFLWIIAKKDDKMQLLKLRPL